MTEVAILLTRVVSHEDDTAYYLEGHDTDEAYAAFGQDVDLEYLRATTFTDSGPSEEVTAELCRPFAVERDPEGKTLEHAHWMMLNLPMSTDQRNRWIGYAQGLLVFHGVIGLTDLRDLTRLVAS